MLGFTIYRLLCIWKTFDKVDWMTEVKKITKLILMLIMRKFLNFLTFMLLHDLTKSKILLQHYLPVE